MITVLLSGVTTGGIYAALVLGVVLVYRFAHAINFAHGAVATLAAYCAFEVLADGMPYWVAALAALLVGMIVNSIIGWILTKVFIGSDEIVQTMASMGPMLAIVGLVGAIWGQQGRSLPLPGTSKAALHIGSNVISTAGVVLLVMIASIVLSLLYVVSRTKSGVKLRAISDSRAVSSIYGLRVVAVERLIWALGGGLAAVASLLIVPQISLLPQSLTDLLIIALAAATLGGLTSVAGVLVGGFVFGLTVALTQYYFQLQMNSILALIVSMLVFAFRPEGLFGRTRLRAVEFFPAIIESSAGGIRRSRSRRPDNPIIVAFTKIRSLRDTSLAQQIRSRSLTATVVVVAITAGVLPTLVSNQLTFTLTTVSIMAIAIAGQNLLSGLAGMLFLAQGGLMLVGAYAAGISATHLNIPLPLAIIIGTSIGAGAALALRLLFLRINGFYLAMVTLLFSLAVPEIALAFEPITNGSTGLFTVGFDVGSSGPEKIRMVFWIASGIAILALTATTLFKRSYTGAKVRAIRDSQRGAEAIGLDPELPRMAAIVLAGGCAGLAGSVSAFHVGVVTPASFTVITSIYILLAAAIGGTESTFLGPIAGAVFIVMLPYVVGGSGSLSQIAFGIGLVVVLAIRAVLDKRRAATVETGGLLEAPQLQYPLSRRLGT